MTFDRNLTWLSLFSLLALTFHPLPLWPGPFPPEPDTSRLPKKPIEGSSKGVSGDHPHSFEPLDLKSLRPVDFGERLAKLFTESYPLDTLKSAFSQLALSPISLFGNPAFSQARLPMLFEKQADLPTRFLTLPASQILSNTVSTFPFESPLLLSEVKEQSLPSLREAFPKEEANTSRAPQSISNQRIETPLRSSSLDSRDKTEEPRKKDRAHRLPLRKKKEGKRAA